MSGDDEDRLDFGEDEELEDQISLGDADEAGGWNGNQQQVLDVNMDAARQSADDNGHQAMVSAANDDAGVNEEPLPAGWVTRVSRQGEMYYFHEATLLSQWDRPTESATLTVDAVESVAPEARSAQPVQAAAAVSKSQDPSRPETAPEASHEVQASSKWGRQTQPLQTQAFTSRSTDTPGSSKSAREVAATAPPRQSAPSSGTSRAPAQSGIADTSGRASPTVRSVPTGPRSVREPPTGPRSQQQDSSRWPVREPHNSQSRILSLPTGPAADRSRPRAPPLHSGHLSERDTSRSTAPPPRHSAPAHRADSGWPVREPVGPPADLQRASTSGFRGPAGPTAPRDSRDRGYDDDQRYPRTDLAPRERVQDPGYRSSSASARDVRPPGRDSRDDGWSRRPPPNDLPVDVPPRRRDPSPPRRARSPPPVRREPIVSERRRRSPSPIRIVRDYPDSRARPVARDHPANLDRNPRRLRRSPSPPPMRRWAVRAITPPPSEEVSITRPELDKKVDISVTQDEEHYITKDTATGTVPTAKSPTPQEAILRPSTMIEFTEATVERQMDQPRSVQQPSEQSASAVSASETKDEKGPQSAEVPPLKLRERRPMSPGLASRLDRPLSQPAPRDTRQRGGRTPPPRQRPSRRSPSPDGQRKRAAPQPGVSLAERMGGGQPSLLSRLGENGRRKGQIEGRPPKRSRRDETGQRDQNQGDMRVDQPELSRRLQGTRSRSRTPPPASRGIAIFGASRHNGAVTAINETVEDAKSAASISERLNGVASQEQASQRSSDMVGREITTDKGNNSRLKDTSTSSSNGQPARPAGFASLPPRPPVIVPPPDFTNRGAPRGGSSTPNPVLLDSYRPGDRPGPPPRRPSSRGPPISDSYQPPPPKEGPILDRYVPRREPLPGRGPRPRSPPPSRGPPSRGAPRRDYR